MAEGEVSRGEHRFEGPVRPIFEPLNSASRPDWHSIIIPFVLLVDIRCVILENGLAIWICLFHRVVRRQIAGEHSLFARFTLVELINQLNVPIQFEAMTAVKLQLVGLISKLLLNEITSIVVILGRAVRL